MEKDNRLELSAKLPIAIERTSYDYWAEQLNHYNQKLDAGTFQLNENGDGIDYCIYCLYISNETKLTTEIVKLLLDKCQCALEQHAEVMLGPGRFEKTVKSLAKRLGLRKKRAGQITEEGLPHAQEGIN